MSEDAMEVTARLENEAIEAMTALVVTYSYTEDDLENLVKAALGNA